MALFRITVGNGNLRLLLSPPISKPTFPSVVKTRFLIFPPPFEVQFSSMSFQSYEARGFPDTGDQWRRWVGAATSLLEHTILWALIWLFVFLSCLFVVFNALTSLRLGEPICHSNGNLSLAIGLTATQPWSTMIKLWKLCLCSLDQWNLQAFLLDVPKRYVAVPWLTWQVFLDYKLCQ